MGEKERAKITHEINNVYHMRFQGKRVGVLISHDLEGNTKIYKFVIHGFDEYTIFSDEIMED